MSTAVSGREFNFWDHHPLHLPNELITFIFSILPPTILGRTSLTCKRARVLSNDPKIWKTLCKLFNCKAEQITNFQTLFKFHTGILLPRLIAHQKFRTQFIPTTQKQIGRVFLQGQHSVFYESSTWKIKKLTLGTQQITPILSRSALGVSSWIVSGNFLYLGTWHGDLMAWCWKNQKITIFQPDIHSGWVCNLATSEHLLASGCSAGEIHLWEMPSLKHLQTFSGHSSRISRMQFKGTSLFTSAWNGNIIEWDCKTGSLIRAFFTRDHQVSQWQIVGEHLFITSQRGTCLERCNWSQGANNWEIIFKTQDPILSIYVTFFGKTLFTLTKNSIQIWHSMQGSFQLMSSFFHLGASCASFQETSFCSGSQNGSFLYVGFHPHISFFDQRPGSPKL